MPIDGAGQDIQIDVNQVSQELRIRPEIYTRILSSFVETLRLKMNLLNQALSDKDFEGMRKILHEIKGTAGNLRLKNISSVQEILHTAVKAQESYDKLMEYTCQLKTESDKLYEYVQQMTKV